ncbi:hypothetical protein ACH47C_40480 [Streptomyces rishiriensis]|uniref:aromatic-ring hydroxylase C-terminal domain-containing protein n=1 Tax=Streptomyces rishiriensis TaxID=68264 RepID=UPI0033CB2B12
MPHCLDRPTGGTGRPAEACGIGDHGAMLVRPDHVVAWRTTRATPCPTAVLAEATRRALRPTRAAA